MREDLEARAQKLAVYIIEGRTTIRAAAKHFGISKSTVHKDLSERLERYDRPLYLQVKEILEQNKAERHIRGGDATRRKYQNAAVCIPPQKTDVAQRETAHTDASVCAALLSELPSKLCVLQKTVRNRLILSSERYILSIDPLGTNAMNNDSGGKHYYELWTYLQLLRRPGDDAGTRP